MVLLEGSFVAYWLSLSGWGDLSGCGSRWGDNLDRIRHFRSSCPKRDSSPTCWSVRPIYSSIPIRMEPMRTSFQTSYRSRSIFCISRYDQLHRQLLKFIEIEPSGTRPAQPYKLTPEEERAVRWAGFPWVRDDLILPNNRQAAYKFSNHLERSFAKRDPSYIAKLSA